MRHSWRNFDPPPSCLEKRKSNTKSGVRLKNPLKPRDSRGRDRVVVGFTTTYTIGAYHNWCCEFESWSPRGVQYYVTKFDSDLRQIDWWFFPGPPVSTTNKTDRHLNIFESGVKRHQTSKQTNPLKSYWTQTFKNMGVGDKFVGILQAGNFLMDPIKETAWKWDFKLKQKLSFFTFVPFSYIWPFISCQVCLTYTSTKFHQESKQKNLPKVLETQFEILNKRCRKPEGKQLEHDFY